MNTPDLIARVQQAVKDDSFTEAEILSRLNDALQAVAFEFCLPELEADDEIAFTAGGDSFAPLPDDYHHDLWHIDPLTFTDRILVMGSLKSLQRIYAGNAQGGTIYHAAVDGLTLHVRPLQTQDQTVKVYYYRKPDGLTNEDTSIPEGIPAHLHTILSDKVASELFDIIEDGVDGNKANTNRYEQRYMAGLMSLQQYAKRAPRLTPYIRRRVQDF